MSVAGETKKSTMFGYMATLRENCRHSEGLRTVVGSEYRCPVCDELLDLDGVARWVRQAERARDEAYAMIEGDEFGSIVREERQREVYRRRKVLYELQNAPRDVVVRPEMVLIVYNAAKDTYECKVFYKEPRPVAGLEDIQIEAGWKSILELRSHADQVVRLVADKVTELHTLRSNASKTGDVVPTRRVFYANEF